MTVGGWAREKQQGNDEGLMGVVVAVACCVCAFACVCVVMCVWSCVCLRAVVWCVNLLRQVTAFFAKLCLLSLSIRIHHFVIAVTALTAVVLHVWVEASDRFCPTFTIFDQWGEPRVCVGTSNCVRTIRIEVVF